MKRLLAAFFTLVLLGQSAIFAAEPPKRELRSTWFTTVANIDWPSKTGTSATIINQQKKELTDYLDNFKKRNLNGICIQVRSMADAIYKSSYEPWASVISGTRGVDPGWDPLQFAIDECHKRGLECWAWVNPFRQRKVVNNYNTPQDKKLESDGLLLTYNEGSAPYTVINPGLAAGRQRSLDVCKEIYTNYAIDGMLFDDYFYPNGIPENSSAADYNLWRNSGTSLSIGDWRRANINKFMIDLYNMIQNDRPDIRFGVGPAGVAYLGAYQYGFSKPNVLTSDWQYGTIYSDPIAWLAEGSIDFISPQLYWFTTHSTAPYEPLVSWWSHVAAHFGRHFYSSQAPYRLNDGTAQNNTAGWAEFVKQIDINRQYTENNAPGSIYYSSKYFDGPSLTGLGQYLQDNSYQRKALTPVVDWKQHPTYGKPASVKYSSGTLSWNAVAGAKSNSIIRYTIYAVPEGISITAAQNPDGDGLDVKYLLDVSYATSFTIPTDKRSGYWYAVCTYDGFGFESAPATYNYPEGESAKTTLTAPINGATPDWNAKFSWTAVSGAVYAIEIASDSQFKNVVISKSDITSTSVTIDLDGLTPKKTMYWRVQTTQNNKLPAWSNSAAFTVPALLAAINPTLVSPADGAELEDNILFKWNAVSGASLYRLIIAADNKFSNIVVNENVSASAKQCEIATSRIGTGTFYWRVESVVPHHADGVSATRSFKVTSIDVGNFEPGYTIKKDYASYEDVDGISFTNIWMRSINAGYANCDWTDNGVYNRGMTISGDYVYVSGRSAASATADIYLAKYSLLTGERVGQLDLNESGKVPYYPCNDVFKDSKGNVLISNLSLVASGVIYIHKVDLNNGNLTLVATINCSDRVDHVGVYGDVDSDRFYVMAVGASTPNIYRWTISKGTVAATSKVAAKSFYPEAANFSIAPRIVPVSETTAYIDGHSTHWSLYNVITGQMLDSFKSNTEIEPTKASSNGGCYFALNGKNYMVYINDDHNTEFGLRFRIVRGNGHDDGFNNLSYYWVFPQSGLGGINSTTCSTQADSKDLKNGSAIVVGFAAGNGMAAYRMRDAGWSGVESLEQPNDAPVQYFNLQGIPVTNPAPGQILIRRQGNKVTKELIR